MAEKFNFDLAYTRHLLKLERPSSSVVLGSLTKNLPCESGRKNVYTAGLYRVS